MTGVIQGSSNAISDAMTEYEALQWADELASNYTSSISIDTVINWLIALITVGAVARMSFALLQSILNYEERQAYYCVAKIA